MHKHQYNLRGKVWLYSGAAAWHFLSLPRATSREIKELFHGLSGGWGSLPVRVRLGATTWQTSIFPDSKTKSYLLPLKAEVRKREGVAAGATVAFSLEILV